ncbi:hypothetical protein [Lederbergia citri]|uniref:Uncharacterized protein n=1 Tax=Lederbergia citri TaxID=2833580 RepID=A0A942YHF3_9BACI|nr:hypothetical protein [Lederbergia citri]MBS4195365.1 hypothetical protein [Lederbergia citri]
MLDEWHSLPETWDNALDAQIAKWYSNPPQVWPERGAPYFSPSAATKCPRELYMKAMRAKRDVKTVQPHQSRWQKLGTAFGSVIQREILAIERNFERLTGNKPRFTFEKNPDGTPRFEEFAKTNKLVEHNGEKFYLYGAPDGIMRYLTDDGEVIRVGLEIKSKQQSPSKTSTKSLTKAQESHEAQTALYAYMYDCDYYIVLYVNGAKRAWDMSAEEYADFPDIRAFCRRITDADRKPLFDKFAMITKAIRENNPPSVDLDGWKFNEYKTAIAESMSDSEYEYLKNHLKLVLKSGLPDWKKQAYYDAFEFIKSVREAKA